MAVVKINLSCELTEAVKVQYIRGNLFSQDNQANVINVAVFEGGEPAELAGTVTANVIRPDGGTVAVTGGTFEGNVATITMPSAVYAIPGMISVAVKITLDSVVTTIAAFAATVYATSTDTAVDPGTIIPSIQTLIAEIEAAVDSIPADYSSLWATLAPNYSNLTFPVAVGQYCTYDGGFYRCNTAIATQEAWTAAHWTATNIGADLAETRLDVANLEDDVSELKSPLTDNIDGTNKGFKELSTGERSVYLYSEYGIKNTGELYKHTDQGFSTYVIFVGGLTSITPSRGDVYAFYKGFPHEGSISYNGSRVVQNVSNVEITIPDGVSYLAVRATNTVSFTYVNKLVSVKYTGNSDIINDLDNIAVNGIYRYAANSSNAPDSDEGIAIAFGTNNNTVPVIAISSSGKAYERITWDSITYAWKMLSDIDTVLCSSKAITPTYAKDADNLKDNTVYVYTFGWTSSDTDMLHFPITGFSGTILTLGADTATTFKSQIAIYVYGSDTRFYYRAKYANWNDWKRLEETGSDLTPFAGFRKIGVIGDSLASGEAVANNGGTNQFIDNYDYSWIQYIARRDGQTAFNFSSGGLTTRSWLTSANGLTKLQNADNKCQCYIIALGVNDAGTLGYSYIGTIDDINTSDPSQNEDTFYGNYGKIISAIQAIEANAKIFMMTMPSDHNEGHRTAVNGAIRSIANSNLFDNCYLIELTDDDVAVPSIANNLRVGHYNAAGYEAISRVIEKKINQYMNTNWSEFRTIEFIGTNYSYTFT